LRSFGGNLPTVANSAFEKRPNSLSMNPEKKFTQTAPPFFATALSIASVMFLGWFASSRLEECDASTGFFTYRITSQNIGSDTCEMSTITPSRAISSITRRPNAVSPTWSPVSPEDPPIGFEFDHVSVR
jgi:hypothetical protein